MNSTTPRCGSISLVRAMRIGELAAARQLQEQEGADASECDRAAADDAAAVLHGSPSGAIDLVPEILDARMRSAPFSFNLLALGFVENSRRKFLDRAGAPHVAAGEIRGFSDFPLGRFRREAAVRHVQHPASEDAIRFVARILCGVVTCDRRRASIARRQPRRARGFRWRRNRRRSACGRAPQ